MNERRWALLRAGLMLAQVPIILIEASEGRVVSAAFWTLFLIGNGVGLYLWRLRQKGRRDDTE